jgi:hypothetical protein
MEMKIEKYIKEIDSTLRIKIVMIGKDIAAFFW